jgi:phosphoribosylformimino-5-aminoimidazole carboxamide ribotide isomerase
MDIIPAIDILHGKCVRLTQGDYAHPKIYNENPLEVAKAFEDAGLQRLHLVDLDGARAGQVRNWKILELLATRTRLRIDFGGGVNSHQDIQILFNGGAQWASVGSVAVRDEELFSDWLIQYGPEKFLLGADVKGEQIAVRGWLELTEIRILDFIGKYLDQGITHIFCTDISRDGLLQGPSIELYEQIISKFPSLHFIASGGVRSTEDIVELNQMGCKGVIIGKAIYEGKIGLGDLTLLQGSLNRS